MNAPYDDKKWLNYLTSAKGRPWSYKIQSFGTIVLKQDGKYYREKKYIYSEFIRDAWRKRDETTVLVPVEGAREAKGTIAHQVEMRNYDPTSNPSPYQWYLTKITCRVPDNIKNVLLTKSFAFQLKSGSIIQGGFVINEIDKEFSQKLSIDKPSFKESGGQFNWLEKGKPKKSNVKEVLELFNSGKLLALFASEDWGRQGKVIKLG